MGSEMALRPYDRQSRVSVRNRAERCASTPCEHGINELLNGLMGIQLQDARIVIKVVKHPLLVEK